MSIMRSILEEDAPHRRVAIFLDNEHIRQSAKDREKLFEYDRFLPFCISDRFLVKATVYVALVRGMESTVHPFHRYLRRSYWDVKAKTIDPPGEGRPWECHWSVGMTLDVVRLQDRADDIVIVAGDPEYVDLASYVRDHGMGCELVSVPAYTARALIDEVSSFRVIPDEYFVEKDDSKKSRQVA